MQNNQVVSSHLFILIALITHPDVTSSHGMDEAEVC